METVECEAKLSIGLSLNCGDSPVFHNQCSTTRTAPLRIAGQRLEKKKAARLESLAARGISRDGHFPTGRMSKQV